ncbi:hypothetical protein CRG98_012064 [Punica granatum]|uniref:Uncharacterized protein n=1 Tax=Punica granatum TaxID=22663 RepID=A0A2I0KGM9_PUNGR|nr:hypothetical protein CRG98_012064 [Punica granatum]
MSRSQVLQTARTTTDSDSRPLGIRRRSTPELESFSTQHPVKFLEPACSCSLQNSVGPARSCIPQTRRVTSLVPCNCASPPRLCTFLFMLQQSAESPHSCLATVPGHLACAHFFLCFNNQPSHLTRASCNFTRPSRLCTFPFMIHKSAESPRSCFFQPCRVCSPVQVYIHTSQVHRACSLVLLVTLPGLLTRASLLSCFASSPSLLARASCKLAASAHRCEFTFMLRKFAGLLARASCDLAESAHPCEFTFMLRKFAGLLARASCDLAESAHPCEFTFMLRKFAGLLARASCDLAESAHPCEFTFMLRKFAGLLARASCDLAESAHPCEFTFMLRKFAGLLARASCDLAESAHPCEFTFMLRKFAEPARSCFLQPCRFAEPARSPPATLPGLLTRVSLLSCFASSPVCSLVLLATLPSLLTRASLLSCIASSPSLLARASCDLTGSAHPCEFTFMLPKLAEPACSCFLQDSA